VSENMRPKGKIMDPLSVPIVHMFDVKVFEIIYLLKEVR
jgi:hypothetical protein